MIALLIYPDRAVLIPVPDGPAAKYCFPGQRLPLSAGLLLDDGEGTYWSRLSVTDVQWEDCEAVVGELPEKKFGHVADEPPTTVRRRKREGAA